MPPQVEVVNAVKRFGPRAALAGVDLSIDQGERVALLGPNGAGKTTLMRCVYGAAKLTDGSVRTFGHDPVRDGPAVRSRLGVVTQADTLDPESSVMDNLVAYARFFGLTGHGARAHVGDLLDRLGLYERRDDEPRTLSGGLRRRVLLARALVPSPELLILDEPTTGLDIDVRNAFWQALLELHASGVTLVLTTHNLFEASRLAERIVIMDQGRIVDQGAPDELIERIGAGRVIEVPRDVGEEALRAVDGVRDVLDAGASQVVLADDAAVTADGLRAADIHVIAVRDGNLEDVFLALTGRRLE